MQLSSSEDYQPLKSQALIQPACLPCGVSSIIILLPALSLTGYRSLSHWEKESGQTAGLAANQQVMF